MPQKVFQLTLCVAAIIAAQSSLHAANALTAVAASSEKPGVLWSEPADIASRDLYYGAGGEKNQPHPPFTFVEEDSDGTQPKFVVKDRDDVKWTVKLGFEARPETVASRLVWAAGYFANENYFLSEMTVSGMPAHLKRGDKLVGPGGAIRDARLKRHMEGQKAVGDWDWRKGPFAGTRELNGLRVIMALINDWDVKKVNNKIYTGKENEPPVYLVSDLGATFGPAGVIFPLSRTRGDLEKYSHSKFIRKITLEYVDFEAPRAPFGFTGIVPIRYLVSRARLDRTMRHVPRDDAHWMGTLLSRLSMGQIHDAFRAAAYNPDEIVAFSNVVADRIRQLKAL